MPTAETWKRRYEAAEAERLRLAGELRDAALRLIDTAADEQQQQIDALEQLVLNRAALTDIKVDGRTLRFTFVRRGAVHQVDTYNAMGLDVAAIRKTLLED